MTTTKKATQSGRVTITLNGRDFSPSEFTLVITPRSGESTCDHARRIAQTIGVGVVITTVRV